MSCLCVVKRAVVNRATATANARRRYLLNALLLDLSPLLIDALRVDIVSTYSRNELVLIYNVILNIVQVIQCSCSAHPVLHCILYYVAVELGCTAAVFDT